MKVELMWMKNILMLCAVLTFAVRASGQQTTTYDTGIGHATPMIPTVQSQLPNTLMGVVIESWRYDPAQKAFILHLVNHSNKTVTRSTFQWRKSTPMGAQIRGTRRA
jgi:hypothetical protein